MSVSIHNRQNKATVTDISRTVVYPSPAQYWSLHTRSALPVFPAAFDSYRREKSIAHRRQNTRLLAQNHESVSFCSARLWTSGVKRAKTFPDDSVLWRRLLHQLTTSHTTHKVVVFFFFFMYQKWKILWQNWLAVSRHTVHAKYCWFSLTVCYQRCIQCVMFLFENTIQRQHGWLHVKRCKRTKWEPFPGGRRDTLRLFLKDEEKKSRDFIFVFQQGFYDIVIPRCYWDKSHLKNTKSSCICCCCITAKKKPDVSHCHFLCHELFPVCHIDSTCYYYIKKLFINTELYVGMKINHLMVYDCSQILLQIRPPSKAHPQRQWHGSQLFVNVLTAIQTDVTLLPMTITLF